MRKFRRRPGWFVVQTAASLAVLTALVGSIVVASRDWGESAQKSIVDEHAAHLLDAAAAPAARTDCLRGADAAEDCNPCPPARQTGNQGLRGACVVQGSHATATAPAPSGDVCPPVDNGDYSQVAQKMAAEGLSVRYCMYVHDRHEFAAPTHPADRLAYFRGHRSDGCRSLGTASVLFVREATILAFRAKNPEYPTRLHQVEGRTLSSAEAAWTAVPAEKLLGRDPLGKAGHKTWFGRSEFSQHVRVLTRDLREENKAGLGLAVVPWPWAQLTPVRAEWPPIDDKHPHWDPNVAAAVQQHARPDLCVPVVADPASADRVAQVAWERHDKAKIGACILIDHDNDQHTQEEPHIHGAWMTRPGWNPPPTDASTANSTKCP